MSTANQVLDLPNYWCGASDPVLQTAAVRLRFVQSVYLTQLQVRSNSVTFNVFLHANDTLYRNIMGFNVSSLIHSYVLIQIFVSLIILCTIYNEPKVRFSYARILLVSLLL